MGNVKNAGAVALRPRLWLGSRIWRLRCWIAKWIWTARCWAGRAIRRIYDWASTPDGGTLVARLMLLALLSVAVYVGSRIYPLSAPQPTARPGFVDFVLASRALVFAARMTILFAAGFLVLSVSARIWNKQWLSKAGPFEVQDAASATQTIDGEVERLERELEDALEALIEQDEMIEQLLEVNWELEARVKEISDAADGGSSIRHGVSANGGSTTWVSSRIGQARNFLRDRL